jgi:hypothetical protein
MEDQVQQEIAAIYHTVGGIGEGVNSESACGTMTAGIQSCTTAQFTWIPSACAGGDYPAVSLKNLILQLPVYEEK